DVDTAMDVARRLETGICHINDSTVNDEPPMPFGGVKSSGWGRFGGKAALEEFTALRWITIQDGPRQYPIWRLDLSAIYGSPTSIPSRASAGQSSFRPASDRARA